MSKIHVDPAAAQHFAAADFRPRRNETFAVEGWPHGLLLREIHEGAAGGFRVPFTLIFQGPAGALLPEGLRRLKAADAAVFDLYLMPVHTPDSGRQDYQAAFN
ncbi:DUF6916 family protein [Rhodoblastus sp.]|uniref:DUF6916 family protein n=1 Tax=Rhodoblastus sp. TaxID=1962975 RepID=UPI003F9D5CD9